MHSKNPSNANEYRCAIERNQNGKYNVRVRAVFGPGGSDSENGGSDRNGHSGWMLPVYFLASSFNAAMKKLEESLQLLQKNEARLRFWGVERTDDPNLAGDLLQEFGLWLDRRREFPSQGRRARRPARAAGSSLDARPGPPYPSGLRCTGTPCGPHRHHRRRLVRSASHPIQF